jgi:hypothetical protein
MPPVAQRHGRPAPLGAQRSESTCQQTPVRDSSAVHVRTSAELTQDSESRSFDDHVLVRAADTSLLDQAHQARGHARVCTTALTFQREAHAHVSVQLRAEVVAVRLHKAGACIAQHTR